MRLKTADLSPPAPVAPDYYSVTHGKGLPDDTRGTTLPALFDVREVPPELLPPGEWCRVGEDGRVGADRNVSAMEAKYLSRSPARKPSNNDLTSSTFSCDIGYSDSPTASRASDSA